MTTPDHPPTLVDFCPHCAPNVHRAIVDAVDRALGGMQRDLAAFRSSQPIIMQAPPITPDAQRLAELEERLRALAGRWGSLPRCRHAEDGHQYCGAPCCEYCGMRGKANACASELRALLTDLDLRAEPGADQ